MQNASLPTAAVIGGGPAGLMAAEVLIRGSVQVDLYESMPSVGRKLLVAGSSGLNLTHSEPLETLLERYGKRRPQLEPMVRDFSPEQLRQWALDLGVETFVGTSGRVFPVEMNAASLLKAWKNRLLDEGVHFHPQHKWVGWDAKSNLRFETPSGEIASQAGAVVLALGGGSWPQLGSTGTWVAFLRERGIPVVPFRPANCGFEVPWSEHFRTRFAGQPAKSVVIEFETSGGEKFRQQGEFVVTQYGVEGSLIYALSAPLRDEIEATGAATLRLDLVPDWSVERLVERLSRPRGKRSVSSHLKKSVGLEGVKAGLLWEFVPRPNFDDPAKLAATIKSLPLPLVAPRPLEEAISSAGGVDFSALDERLMIRSLPGIFCAGEMLDWEAPTGGYLLTACFASGRAAGLGALDWLKKSVSGTG
jgi:uncharacterized flavoprotein (TIGR03862 family)